MFQDQVDRRSFLAASASAAGLPFVKGPHLAGSIVTPSLPDFPRQDPARVRDVVGASHGNFERVRELVDASPALSRASWDWGFGDWEFALGAASHTGNADIARYLIDKGARPSIFSAAMLGDLTVVEAMVNASPGAQSIPGPHGIPLLAHARAGGQDAAAVLDYLEALGDADVRPASVALQDPEPYIGRYRFGPDARDVLEVVEDNGRPWIRRADDPRRGMTYVGDHAFFPAGAPEVRIRFAVEGGSARRVEVYDPGLIVRAERVV